MVRWRDLTVNQQKAFGNGCGPAWLPESLTKLLFGWFFEASCRRHDFAYARGGTERDRRRADKGFLKAMQRDVARYEDKSTLIELFLHLLSLVFYCLVRCFGWLRFNYGPYLTLEELLTE